MPGPHIRYPVGARAVINVTAAPHYLDNTGRRDCTAGLVRLLDEVLAAEVRGMGLIREKLQADPDPDAQIGFESRKIGGRLHIVFPEVLPEQRIIYFPNGTYLLSDTVSYTLQRFHNTLGNELNRGIRLVGESQEGVCLKLKDDCPGFGVGAARPVLSFMRGRRSNIAMSNYLENMTIDVGAGNPGAIGVVFFANNTGAVRRVHIRSSDPEDRGDTGFAILHELASGTLVQDLSVSGFDFGVRVEPLRMYTVFENITLERQRDAGFAVGNTVVSVRGLTSRNKVPALTTHGPLAHVVLIDADCSGGSAEHAALSFAFGVVLARNIRTEGYQNALSYHGRVEVAGPAVSEWCSHPVLTLFPGQPKQSLGLPIEPAPSPRTFAVREWLGVDACGARGDGTTDATAAIQSAMNLGSPVIYFQPGKYLVNGVITVPPHVECINFMHADLIAGPDLKRQAGEGLLKVVGEADKPLFVENLFAWEAYHGFQTLVNHASKRTVVLRDLHAQTGAIYRNETEGGKVFIENVCCTIGSRGIADDKGAYGHVPCFEFRGQSVWARQINPERSHHEVVNRASTLWVLGFKTEGYGTAFDTSAGGKTEILGGVLNIGKNKPVPAFCSVDSEVSVVATSNGYAADHCFPIVVRETRDGVVRELGSGGLPTRFCSQFCVPLYAGRSLPGDQQRTSPS